MALSIININVNVTGSSTRFFNILTAPLSISEGTTVAAGTFLNDSGGPVTEFPIVNNGYYNLYINGVMQEGGSYNVSASEITFNDVTAVILTAKTPLILEAVELVTVT